MTALDRISNLDVMHTSPKTRGLEVSGRRISGDDRTLPLLGARLIFVSSEVFLFEGLALCRKADRMHEVLGEVSSRVWGRVTNSTG
jgi:hypothetical protein